MVAVGVVLVRTEHGKDSMELRERESFGGLLRTIENKRRGGRVKCERKGLTVGIRGCVLPISPRAECQNCRVAAAQGCKGSTFLERKGRCYGELRQCGVARSGRWRGPRLPVCKHSHPALPQNFPPDFSPGG